MTIIPKHLAIRSVAGTGSGLFTNLAIQPGSEILNVDRPLVSVLNSGHLKTACTNCFLWMPDNGVDGNAVVQTETGIADEKKLKACQGCKIVRYCSKDCQAQSWKIHHKHECKIFAKLYPKILPNTVRIVMQLLLRRKSGNLPDRDWQNLIALQTHVDDFRSSPTKNEEGLTTYQTIELMSQATSTYSGSKEPLSLIQSLTARVLVNTLTLTTPAFDPLGLCLCTQAALMNHSCTPNTAITFSGPILSVRSLAPIPADTELTISYLDTTNGISTRQNELQSRYFFTCACPACSRGMTNCMPDPPSDTSFKALEVRAVEFQTQASSLSPDRAAPLLKEALALFKSYPPHRQPQAAILQTAFLNAIACQAWPLALTYALKAYFDIDPVHYQPDWHPVRVVRKWVLLRLVVQIVQLASEGDGSVKALNRFEVDWQVVAVGLLGEVGEGVKLSHGEDSKFKTEVETFANGLGLSGMQVGIEVVRKEKEKLRRVADGALP